MIDADDRNRLGLPVGLAVRFRDLASAWYLDWVSR
jgi:hypothetical protein